MVCVVSATDGGPAFPVANPDYQTFQQKTVDDTRRLMSGMSLVHYFAAKTAQGLCANQDWLNNVSNAKLGMSTPEIVAATAFEIAEAMLKAGAKYHERN